MVTPLHLKRREIRHQYFCCICLLFVLSICGLYASESRDAGRWLSHYDSGTRPAIHNESSITGEYQRFYLDENSTLDSVSLVVYSAGDAECQLQVYSYSRGNIFPHKSDLVASETIHLDSGYNKVLEYVGSHLEAGQFFVGVSFDKGEHLVRVVSDRVTNGPECQNEFGEVFTYQVMRTKDDAWISGLHDYNIGVHLTTDAVDSRMYEEVNDCNLPEVFHSEVKSLVVFNANDDNLPDVLMNGRIWNNEGDFRFVPGSVLTNDTLGVYFAVELNGASSPEIIGISNRSDIESQVFRRSENGAYIGSSVAVPSGDVLSISSIDWNGDDLGDILLVVSTHQNEDISSTQFVVVYGSRANDFEVSYENVDGVTNPRNVSVADIDRNGVKDIIVRSPTELSVHYRESDGSISSSSFRDVSLLVGTLSGDVVLQNDSLLGIIASTLEYDADLFALLEDGKNETDQFIEGVSLHSTCLIGDLDLDGTDDAVMISGCTCRTVEVQNDVFGVRSRATVESGLMDVALDESAVLIDLDGDSDLDVLGHTGKYLRVLENSTINQGRTIVDNEFTSNQQVQQSDCSGVFFSSWFNREQTLGNAATATDGDLFRISAKPNPIVDYVVVTVESEIKEENSSGILTLTNAIGEVVVRESIDFSSSTYRLVVPSILGNGAYQLTIECDSGSSSTMIVVQR